MAAQKRVFLFGDQTVETYHSIKELARHSRRSSSLSSFFRKSYDAVNDVISKLHTSERGRFFSFGSIMGLAEAYVDSGVNDVVISTILLCFAQLGFLIMYASISITPFLAPLHVYSKRKKRNSNADPTDLVARNMMPVFSIRALLLQMPLRMKYIYWDCVLDYSRRRRRQRRVLPASCQSLDRRF